MKEQFEVVDRELLEREITSKRFVSGIERAIDIATHDRSDIGCKDLEVLYEINKELFGSRLNYPDSIIIGNEKTVGLDTAYKFANQLYKKFYQTDENDEDYFEFSQFCLENRLLIESYPLVEKEFSFIPEDNEIFYPLFHFHTHPSCEPTPSNEDTRVMTQLRSLYNKWGLFVKPIMAIIGTSEKDKRKGSYPILFFQEKAIQPLDGQRYEARRYSHEYYLKIKKKDAKDKLTKVRVEFLMNMLNPGLDPSVFQARPLYKCGLAYYKPGETKLDMGFDIGKFSYVASTKTREERK